MLRRITIQPKKPVAPRNEPPYKKKLLTAIFKIVYFVFEKSPRFVSARFVNNEKMRRVLEEARLFSIKFKVFILIAAAVIVVSAILTADSLYVRFFFIVICGLFFAYKAWGPGIARKWAAAKDEFLSS
jgi:hypothetical protein